MAKLSIDKAQVRRDLDSVQVALEHALTYPSKAGKMMDQATYHAAHAELQQSLGALQRLRRVFNGSTITSNASTRRITGRDYH